MLLAWEFLAFSTRACLCIDTFDVWAFVFLARASFAALHNMELAGTAVDTALTDEVFIIQLHSSIKMLFLSFITVFTTQSMKTYADDTRPIDRSARSRIMND
jgi:hypothetical protein